MGPPVTSPERAAALEARLLAAIPLASAMQVRITHFDGERIRLEAPLRPNINDKGTGFAGSLATLVTLSGWCLATLVGEADGERCEAAVYRSETDFLRPVREALRAEAWIADPSAADKVRARLRMGARAKLPIRARLGPEEDPAVLFSGNYAVWRVGTQPF